MFLYFQFSSVFVPYLMLHFSIYKTVFNFMYISDPSKIKRMFVYHIKYNINNRWKNQQNFVVFYVTSWKMLLELKYASRMTLFSCSLLKWGLRKVMQIFSIRQREYNTSNYILSKEFTIILSLQFYIFRSFASWIEILFRPILNVNGWMIVIIAREREQECDIIL
jgi:hypothetical protein